MRILLTIIALLIAAPAFAMSDSAINFCKTMNDPMECIKEFAAAEREARQERAALQAAQERMAIAEEQTRGMALFGSGYGMINGMNQGFNNMRVAPPIPMQIAPR